MKNIGLKEPAEINKYAQGGTEQSRADVKLALSIGWDRWQNGGGRSDYVEKLVELGSIGDVRDTSTLTSLGVPACFRDNQNSPNSVLSMDSIANNSIMHAPYVCTTSSPNGILCRGLKHHLNDAKNNMTSSFCQREELDLNKYPCDDLFSQCNDVSMADSSGFNIANPHRLVGEFQFCFSPCSHNEREKGANFTPTSSWVQKNAESTYTKSENKSIGQSDNGSIVYHTNIESVSGMSSGMHRNSNSNHNFVDMPAPSNETCRDVMMQDSSSLIVKDVEISKVSYQGNIDEGICSNRGMLFKKKCSVEKFSGSNIVQVGNDLYLSNVSSREVIHSDESSACAKSSHEQDSELSFVNDVKAQRCQETDEVPLENDSSVQRGEVSLESFESIVLKLPENNADDYCVTSKQYEVDDTSTRDSGIKLRRGTRRIKDFRKDVLPHLPSLSPAEIWEDMKIIQGALRSREYKTLRSKVQNGQSASTALKSRRTRSNLVARRRNS